MRIEMEHTYIQSIDLEKFNKDTEELLADDWHLNGEKLTTIDSENIITYRQSFFKVKNLVSIEQIMASWNV